MRKYQQSTKNLYVIRELGKNNANELIIFFFLKLK